MERRKIKLANWVYETLIKYGNVALPNSCIKFDRTQLINHFKHKIGSSVRIREADFIRYNGNGEVFDKTTYLIAEEK